MTRTDHDGLFKELLRTFFAEFVAAFLPNMAQYLEPDSIEFLDKELIRDIAARRKHTVDILVKARFRGEETFFLVHVENQAKTEADFPERMFDYFSWLRAKYRLPIYPVVIFSFAEPQRPEPNRFRVDFPGERVLNFRYKVIQLNRLPLAQVSQAAESGGGSIDDQNADRTTRPGEGEERMSASAADTETGSGPIGVDLGICRKLSDIDRAGDKTVRTGDCQTSPGRTGENYATNDQYET